MTHLLIYKRPFILSFHFIFSIQQQAELRLDTIQPRVESILKESKTVTASESPNSEKIRHSLLDLSGRWLKACDDVDRNKRAITIVPKWYQFRSNLEEINDSMKLLDGDDRPERYVKVRQCCLRKNDVDTLRMLQPCGTQPYATFYEMLPLRNVDF